MLLYSSFEFGVSFFFFDEAAAVREMYKTITLSSLGRHHHLAVIDALVDDPVDGGPRLLRARGRGKAGEDGEQRTAHGFPSGVTPRC